MKTSTSDLRNLLHGSTSAAFDDLFTLTDASASVLARWTTAPYDISYGGNTYTAGGNGTAPVITRGRIREAVGLDVSTLDVTLGCGTSATIGGVAIQTLAVNGGLDGCRLAIQRAYMATAGGSVVGVISRFSGAITVRESSSSTVRMEVKSDLYRLDELLPRHLYRDRCSWALFDSGCGLSKSSFSVTDTCDSGCTTTTVKFTRPTPLIAWSGIGGTVTFTSGALLGLSRNIQSWSYVLVTDYTYTMTVVALPEAPGASDAITVVAGCDKSIATCDTVFSNLTRRRGFDFMPAPDYAST